MLLAYLGLAVIGPAFADIYISDGDRIGRFGNDGTVLNSTFATLPNAAGLALGADGFLYAASFGGPDGTPGVWRFDATTGAPIDGGAAFVWYHGQPPTPDSNDVIVPQGLQFGPGNRLYVADQSGATSNVHVYDAAGSSVGALNSPDLISPRAIAFDAQSRLYVTSANTVLRYDFGSSSYSTFAEISPGQQWLNDARDLAFGPDGYLYVLDGSVVTPGIVRFTASGSFDPTFHVDYATSTFYPSGLAFGLDGTMLVSGYDALGTGGEVRRYDLTGAAQGNLIPDGTLTWYNSFMLVTPEPGSMLAATVLAVLAVTRRGR